MRRNANVYQYKLNIFTKYLLCTHTEKLLNKHNYVDTQTYSTIEKFLPNPIIIAR